ncbi:hypothetical protein Ddye_032216 [Dipteronia dyeriana]|uniref:Ubiquitin-like protease family profile domain-containing protein n=1 Tax=Dipteronia dyeriana TaxID=168575 RepID=A0AAD9WN06_9ROSI|nr:hypothetical protein Ddye_032216 [Dipteronia dyeriana]
MRRDVDVLALVKANWFRRKESNFMDFEDTVLIPCNVGLQHWLLVTVDLTLEKMDILDPWRQDVPLHIRKQQL